VSCVTVELSAVITVCVSVGRRDLDVETERRKNAEIIVVRTREQLTRSEAQQQLSVVSFQILDYVT